MADVSAAVIDVIVRDVIRSAAEEIPLRTDQSAVLSEVRRHTRR